jgi:putative nucleotidyltransferase with HDIG domain
LWLFAPVVANEIGALVFLGVATQVAALAPIRWLRGSHAVYTASLIAAGLVAPGAGVAILTWLCTFDGRIPSRGTPLWRLLFFRANLALAHGIPSLLVVHFLPLEWASIFALPIRTVLYSLLVLSINYPLTAGAFAFANRTSPWDELLRNASLAVVQSLLLLGIAGGSLFALLQLPSGVGYVMSFGLLGFLVLARANMSHAQALQQTQLQTLQLAAEALDARDAHTESHSQRVAELAVRIGEQMDLGHRAIEALRTAGMLHDLGKIGIRDHILNKPSKLTPEEWDVMKEHAALGAEMIAKHSQLAQVAPLVRSHHERFDGSGYPDGLVGYEIPLGARILGVADSFDTMTGPRIYRQSALTPVDAVAEITDLSGRLYDPQVVLALRRLYGVGDARGSTDSTVWRLLSSNRRYATYLVGTAISAAGDPMTTVATLVTIYATTKQPALVALAYAIRASATVLVGSVAGSLPDRVDRRRLIMTLEVARAALLAATPILLVLTMWTLLPILFLLAAVNAIIQPARQASIAALVDEHDLTRANAITNACATIAGLVGFPIAGLMLASGIKPSLLFPIDGATFALAGLTLVGLNRLGGGVKGARLFGAFRVGLRVQSVRPQLLLSAIGAFFIGMSFPSLIALAYELSTRGAVAYAVLETVLAAGVITGSVFVSRTRNREQPAGAMAGLAMMGAFSLLIGVSPWLALTCALLFFASVGNPIYTVANQTAVLRGGDTSNQSTLMSARFVLAQIGVILGSAAGGVITGWLGPRASYALMGAALMCVAIFIAGNDWRRRADLDLLRATGRDALRVDETPVGEPVG